MRGGQVNSETGEFISDLAHYALQQQQAAMSYAGLGQSLGGLLAGTGVTLTTANTSGSTYITGNTYLYGGSERTAPAVAAAPVKDDEFSWLRKRVEDVCWKQAA